MIPAARRLVRTPALLGALMVFVSALACRTAPLEETPHAYGDVRAERRSPAGRAPSAASDGRVKAELAPSQPADSAPAASLRAADGPAIAHEHANRDKHAPRDVAEYIAKLEKPERVAELKIDVVLSKLALPRDSMIGDLGCGPGLFTIAFARACPAGIVFASDVEPAQLDRVRQKAAAGELDNIVPVLASANDPHFPAERLDVVFLADTYHHLEDRVGYMRRLRNTLKPGGRVVLLEYKPGKLPVGPPPEHKLPAGVMDREMELAGYVLIDRFATHAWHDFEVWRVRGWEPARNSTRE